MKKVILCVCCLWLATTAAAQKPVAHPVPAPLPQAGASAPQPVQGTSSVSRRVESYLRDLYALGPKYTVRVGEPQLTPIPGLRSVNIDISAEGQSNQITMYVSDDGRYLLQGELADMHADPFTKIRAQMDLSSAPSHGPANAKVVVVEYADLQCPSCRRLSEILRGLFPNYPQVRFLFREFPLTQIHAWSMTAAIAGRCIFHKSAAAFWPYAHYMFDHQDSINPSNVWDTVVQQGVQAGYDADSFKACMADPAMKAEVDKSEEEGVQLKVSNTPTVFVNGRRLVGPDREALEQYIDYELAKTEGAKKP
ncbi:MAG TPA: thioredoxin domain-containing protein [Patescibacteria group bacterium]|nr:thioredoxin domain-containing protein [Patescibacteria group bacterium]